MPLLEPKATVHFSEVYDDGMLLDMEHGRYLELNRSATLLWRTLRHSETMEEAVAELRERIDANDEILVEAARRFLRQVREAGLTSA